MWKKFTKRFQSPDSFVSLALGLAVVLVIGMLIVNYISTKQRAGESAQKETTEQLTLPATHTVGPGESLWTIAQTYYRDGYKWVDIAQANNLERPDFLEVGQTLTVPVVATAEGQISADTVEAKPEGTRYTAVAGDSLWNIAVKQYGTGYKWVDIARANNLVNPSIIHAGNVFVLP